MNYPRYVPTVINRLPAFGQNPVHTCGVENVSTCSCTVRCVQYILCRTFPCILGEIGFIYAIWETSVFPNLHF